MNGFGHVWAAVEAFRRKHLSEQEDRLPVDVFTVVELRLRLDVILIRLDREGLWPGPQ